jgi:hypothetical protein
MASRAIVTSIPKLGLSEGPNRISRELLTAGYAPVWSESDLGMRTIAPIRAALNHMPRQQEPFHAAVVDRRWDLLQANKGAAALVEFLVGPLEPGTMVNLADALVAPNVLAS